MARHPYLTDAAQYWLRTVVEEMNGRRSLQHGLAQPVLQRLLDQLAGRICEFHGPYSAFSCGTCHELDEEYRLGLVDEEFDPDDQCPVLALEAELAEDARGDDICA